MLKLLLLTSSVIYSIANDNGRQKCIDNSDCFEYLTYVKTEFNQYNSHACASEPAKDEVVSSVTELTLAFVRNNCYQNNECQEYVGYLRKEFYENNNR